MKRNAFSGIMLTLLLTSMLTLAFSIQSVSAGVYPAIYIEPESTVDPTLTPDSNYTVSIKTNYTGGDVTAYQFTLSYNPNILKGVEVTNGDLIIGGSARFIAGTFDNEAGTLSLTAGFYFEKEMTFGPGILANVTFTVVGHGTSDITIGDETQLWGLEFVFFPVPSYKEYVIIDAETMPDHIDHGYFDNIKPIHDVNVISIVAPATVVIGQLSNINVVIANEGNFTETFNVTVYTNSILIGTQTGITLTRGGRTTLTFDWDTTDLAVSDCTITVEAILAGDEDLTNNRASTTAIVAPGALNPVPPGYYETSEFLIGSVAVGVILPESNGTIDPSTEDWTSSEEAEVVSKIRATLDWWAAYNPSAGVSFSMEVHYRVPTSYEPINRPVWDDWLWISETMTYLGYPDTDYYWIPDIYTQTLDYVNDLRNRLGTNWAFAIFVADSSNDIDGRFANFPYYAYAHLGGPFFVIPSVRLNGVTAHEMGHIFYATDEYNGWREYSGYLNVSDIDGSGSLMDDSDVLYLSKGTKGQIGWRDTDGDGILDIVDTVPDTTLNPYLPNPTSNSTLTYTGSVTVAAYPNQNPVSWPERRNITINTITNVEYRIDNGPWMNATPTDGAFDETQENFTFTTPSLSGGVHKVEVRGTNSVGNVEMSYASDIVTVIMPTVTATVDIHPNTLKLTSKGKCITAHIELPEGYDVGDINVSTIRLNDEIPVESSKVIGKMLIVRFDRSKITALISQADEVELIITGILRDETPFEGSDTIKVR